MLQRKSELRRPRSSKRHRARRRHDETLSAERVRVKLSALRSQIFPGDLPTKRRRSDLPVRAAPASAQPPAPLCSPCPSKQSGSWPRWRLSFRVYDDVVYDDVACSCFQRALTYLLAATRAQRMSSDDEDIIRCFKPAWAQPGGIPKRAPVAAPVQPPRTMEPQRPTPVRGESERWPGAYDHRAESGTPNSAGVVVVATGGPEV